MSAETHVVVLGGKLDGSCTRPFTLFIPGKLSTTTHSACSSPTTTNLKRYLRKNYELECAPMPNMMAALPNIGGALCSTPQSLADANYKSAMQ